MLTNQSTRDIEQLMAEADELIRQINSDVHQRNEEEHRLQFEIHAQNLKKSNPKFRARSDKKKHRKQAPAPRACMKRFWIL
jgi:ElaB/YqjD/DUF883 family membrane-anchored ribosome-binding protein